MCKDQESYKMHAWDVAEDSCLPDRPLDVRVIFEGHLHTDFLDFLLSLSKLFTNLAPKCKLLALFCEHQD